MAVHEFYRSLNSSHLDQQALKLESKFPSKGLIGSFDVGESDLTFLFQYRCFVSPLFFSMVPRLGSLIGSLGRSPLFCNNRQFSLPVSIDFFQTL